VTVYKKSHAKRASAWERRKSAQVVEERSGRGIDAGVLEDLPHRGRRHLHPENEQLAMYAPVPPPGVSRTRRSTRARIERTVGGRPGRLGFDRAA
jgi:hypothetical protein